VSGRPCSLGYRILGPCGIRPQGLGGGPAALTSKEVEGWRGECEAPLESRVTWMWQGGRDLDFLFSLFFSFSFVTFVFRLRTNAIGCRRSL
jgi:hypothetical protein